MSSPLIEINGRVKKYGERVAVHGVSFSIEEGEIFGLLGPNGAGKTTTLSILSTLFPPDEGEVTVIGHDIVREAKQVKRLIGSVPQELALYPTLSAWDNLAFFGRIYGLQGPNLKERITAVLVLVGLTDRATEAVQTFSGGMKRHLNIAAGLIHRPRILFLDEPTVGVDPQSRNFIFEHKIWGLTVLLLLTLSTRGGCFIPRFITPEWLRTVGLVTPHAWALDAYQDLLVRGYGLWEVLPKVGTLVAFAVAFFSIGVWRFRFE
jgi:ABC-type Na+ transport system ATPase subunit NatA